MTIAAPDAIRPPRSWWIPLGLGVSAVSAAASSFDGLRSLAEASGWSVWMAPALPATIDALAITATGIWITGTSTSRVRRFARTCALVAILMSIGGNACWHLHAAGLLALNFAVVLGVGTIPPIVLGLCSHLAALRRQVETVQAVPEVGPAKTETVPKAAEAVPMKTETALATVEPAPVRPRLEPDELLAFARAAADRYKAEHGKSITRDELRRVLRVGGTKASEVLRHLRAEAS